MDLMKEPTPGALLLLVELILAWPDPETPGPTGETGQVDGLSYKVFGWDFHLSASLRRYTPGGTPGTTIIRLTSWGGVCRII